VLITHGDPDPVIPVSEARLLFAAANEPKKLLIFPGAGHNVFGSVGDPYLDQLVDFIHQSLKNESPISFSHVSCACGSSMKKEFLEFPSHESSACGRPIKG